MSHDNKPNPPTDPVQAQKALLVSVTIILRKCL